MSPFEMNTNCTQMASTSDHLCNTGLSLGLASFNDGVCSSKKEKSVVSLKFDHVLPALSLGPSDQGSSSSKVSSRRVSSDEDDEEEEEASPRKKLRLTKDQSALLEDIFREHSTLNPSQKHALAKQLNLRPRQVEVWFQNRRARTKLKQTETDCELLKKCCERLTEENKRLKKELSELKSIKMAPLYMQMHSSPTLSICPSCDPSLINAVHHRYPSSANRDQKPVFISGTNPNLFFPHSSAAC